MYPQSVSSCQLCMRIREATKLFGCRDRRYCFGGDRPVLVGMVQLAIAIIYDLGLDRGPLRDPVLIHAQDMRGGFRHPRVLKTRTTEERRALLGCFLLSSS